MEIFKRIGPLQAFLNDRRSPGVSVGLIPTMGALHRGHLSLIEAARRNGDITVCSLFVNPTQFNDPRDLEKYPRNLTLDQQMLEGVGCDVLFAPDAQEMYTRVPAIKFEFGEMSRVLEGKFRPGHFSGVGQVVAKLFNIVRPDHAYFGMKDYQQCRIISLLNNELNFGIRLHTLPTVREPDGLAMSSRNARLNSSDRTNATVLYRTLQQSKKELLAGRPWEKVRMEAARDLGGIEGIHLEYFELANKEDLSDEFKNLNECVLLIAAHVGPVRLIDNLQIAE
jgi:pantoate--beta-alanine ligase